MHNNTSNNKEKIENGFTLIEVLIVILIFSIGMLGLSAMQFSAARGNSGAHKLTEATAAASAQLESLLSANYSDPILNPGTYSVNNGPYSISYTITEATSNKVKNIALTVTRLDNVNRTNTYNLTLTNLP